MSVSTSNIGRRADGSFEQYAPPRVVEIAGGGGVNLHTPPGAPGEVQFINGLNPNISSASGYMTAAGGSVPTGTWLASGFASTSLSGTLTVGLHHNAGETLGQALVSATGPTSRTVTPEATITGPAAPEVYLSASTDNAAVSQLNAVIILVRVS